MHSRSHVVRRARIVWVANEDAGTEDVFVQEMVQHIHVVGRAQWPRCAINRAREGIVCAIIRRFPDLVSCQLAVP